MPRIKSPFVLVYLFIIASQSFRIAPCFAFPLFLRDVRCSILPSSRLPLQLQKNQDPSGDRSLEKPSRDCSNISPSNIISRSNFITLVLLTVPMSSAASFGNVESKSSKNATASSKPLNSVTSAKEETISGFVAGAALTLTKTIVKYPMDTATVRLQMPKTKYTIQEPIRLLDDAYVGIAAPLLANVPAGAVFFAVKDAVQASLKSVAGSDLVPEAIAALLTHRFVRTCVAVALAQIPYWIVRNPSEVIKTRQQSGLYTEEYLDAKSVQLISSTSEFNTTVAASGWQGWYTGYWENVLYAYPADVLKFVCYEQLSAVFDIDKNVLNPAESALYGAVATASAQWITTPLDVVRNRVMARSFATRNSTDDVNMMEIEISPPIPFLMSYTASLRTLARTEGLDGFFAGATPRVVKAFISGAIQFATYEETKQAISALFFNIGHQ